MSAQLEVVRHVLVVPELTSLPQLTDSYNQFAGDLRRKGVNATVLDPTGHVDLRARRSFIKYNIEHAAALGPVGIVAFGDSGRPALDAAASAGEDLRGIFVSAELFPSRRTGGTTFPGRVLDEDLETSVKNLTSEESLAVLTILPEAGDEQVEEATARMGYNNRNTRHYTYRRVDSHVDGLEKVMNGHAILVVNFMEDRLA